MTASPQPLAVITGASGGLGREFARIAAVRGYRLLLIARNQAALDQLAQALHTETGTLALDLAEPGSADRISAWLSERNLVPAVLINNAGFGAYEEAAEMDEATVRTMIRLNVTALTTLTLREARRMLEAGGGRIMNVASTAAFRPCPHAALYGATKAYVLSFTEALAEELRLSPVTVTAFCPGPMKTGFSAAAGMKNTAAFDKLAADPAVSAMAGFNAMMRGKAVAYDTVRNRVLSFLPRLFPRSLVRRLTGEAIASAK
ncbi:MAG: SDR family oxidoreductase [Burkholderia sp.]|jgi:uncharacterized protein